jgi:hypothetical protein
LGLKLLDLQFRIERAFNLGALPEGWWFNTAKLDWDLGSDLTIGELHQLVLRECRDRNVEPPPDSLSLLCRLASEASLLDPWEVTADTKVVADIAPGG